MIYPLYEDPCLCARYWIWPKEQAGPIVVIEHGVCMDMVEAQQVTRQSAALARTAEYAQGDVGK